MVVKKVKFGGIRNSMDVIWWDADHQMDLDKHVLKDKVDIEPFEMKESLVACEPILEDNLDDLDIVEDLVNVDDIYGDIGLNF